MGSLLIPIQKCRILRVLSISLTLLDSHYCYMHFLRHLLVCRKYCRPAVGSCPLVQLLIHPLHLQQQQEIVDKSVPQFDIICPARFCQQSGLQCAALLGEICVKVIYQQGYGLQQTSSAGHDLPPLLCCCCCCCCPPRLMMVHV
jgi:hypothetical protein